MQYPELPARIKEILEKNDDLTKHENEEVKIYYMSLMEEEND